ncbi:hypothetical protein HORIV_70410 [Vreelandella olivaria]|uniref:Uncharacterized protein n=1 Tax=Vreelandella olivaria TaxID=390919 RepID=A0ABM7GSK6_9GAMM|nr:hypothetical protein HORIV_70410 [Halomonas olivaria]
MAHIVKVKTGSTFEEHASYSRLVAVDNWIFVSNTAGRHPETKEIPEDVVAQTHQVFANIENRSIGNRCFTGGRRYVTRVYPRSARCTNCYGNYRAKI